MYNNQNSDMKSILFLAPVALTTAIAVVKLFSLPKVPTELPEKLVYEQPTAAATNEPIYDPVIEFTIAPDDLKPDDTGDPIDPNTASPIVDTPGPLPSNLPFPITPNPSGNPRPSDNPKPSGNPNPSGNPKPSSQPAPSSAPITQAPSANPTAAPTPAQPTQAPSGKYKDGEWSNSSMCTDPNNGFDSYAVNITIIIKNGKIYSVQAERPNHTPDQNDYFFELARGGPNGERDGIIRRIYDHGGTAGVDTVTGATRSSIAIIEAADKALAQAANRDHAESYHAITPEGFFRDKINEM